MLADLAKQLAQDLSSAIASAPQAPFNTSELQTLLQSALRKYQLVTREEFDAQALVLARTREKLDALEQQMANLEHALKPTAANTQND